MKTTFAYIFVELRNLPFIAQRITLIQNIIKNLLKTYFSNDSFNFGADLKQKPRDCYDILYYNPDAISGVYTIYPEHYRPQGITVNCDMDTDGGGWIVSSFSYKLLSVFIF